jgi:hypothetical protein
MNENIGVFKGLGMMWSSVVRTILNLTGATERGSEAILRISNVGVTVARSYEADALKELNSKALAVRNADD